MPNVLIVDDESAIRESLKGVLEDEGYKTAAAASGEACLECLGKQSFDVILLDIWLPGMDGLDTLQNIRALADAPESSSSPATPPSKPPSVPPNSVPSIFS